MKHTFTRRDFLGASAALSAAAMFNRTSFAQGFNVMTGAQSYSFRQFPFPECIKRLKELGLTNMEFCSAHFPPNADDPGFANVKSVIEQEGINVLCFGVEEFTGDADANRAKFRFAKALGVKILTANPTPESFASLEILSPDFDVKIAIHNHGPGARYDKAADTLRAVQDRIPYIGACVDTGHVIRSGEKPHEVIEQLGSRVLSLHLKDWIHGGEEQILGKGDIDLVAVAKALKNVGFAGPVMFEYENHPENPVPDMLEGLKNWQEALKSA